MLLPCILLFLGHALGSSDEHVLLMNCNKSNFWSSQVAYYGGTPAGQPGASIPKTSGHWQQWEGGSDSATFADGDAFSWTLDPVPANTFSGTARNQYSTFYCYFKAFEFSYTASDGTICSQIYDCNHVVPQSLIPGDQTLITYDISGSYVNLPEGLKESAQSIVGWAFNRIGEYGVDKTPADLGNGCQISFDGNGDISHTTLKGLANILYSTIAPASNSQESFMGQYTTCLDACRGSSYCCAHNGKQIHRKMLSTLTVYAHNVGSNSDQGRLTYTLTCNPPPNVDCELAKILGELLTAASVAQALADPAWAITELTGSILGPMNSLFGAVKEFDSC